MRRFAVLALVAIIATIGAKAITLDEILEKNIDAKGGRKAMKSLTSMRSKGTVTIAAMGMEMEFTQMFKRDRKLRIESMVQGMQFVIGYDGKTAWMLNPMMGPDAQAMDEEQTAEYAMQADVDGELVDWKTKGHTVEYVGTGDVDGSTAYKVKLTTKKGDVRMYYIDAVTFLELKVEGKSSQMGETIETETSFSNYQEVNGIQMAHQIDTHANGQAVSSVVIKSVETNVPLDDALFTMPKK